MTGINWRQLLERPAETPEPEPADRGPTVGEVLRETRLAKGLSFGEVERDTRINRLYVEALETHRFDALPAPVYARGFMRSYARYLGLDPDEAVRAMPANLPRPPGLEPLPGLRRNAGSGVSLPGFDPKLAGGLVAAVIVLFGLFWGVPRLLDGDTSNPGTTPGGGATSVATETVQQTPVAAATVPPFDTGSTPNFVGVERETAVQLLEQLGLTPFVVEAASETAAPGRVFQQSPSAGTNIAPGEAVTLFVSRGAG